MSVDDVPALVLGFLVLFVVLQGYLGVSVADIFLPLTGGLNLNIPQVASVTLPVIFIAIAGFLLLERYWHSLGPVLLVLFFAAFVHLLA